MTHEPRREAFLMDNYPDQYYTDMPCAVCGADFTPDASHRCQECGRFACRACLKVHYYFDIQGREIPTRTLCYDCFHSLHDNDMD